MFLLTNHVMYCSQFCKIVFLYTAAISLAILDTSLDLPIQLGLSLAHSTHRQDVTDDRADIYSQVRQGATTRCNRNTIMFSYCFI